MTSIDAGEAQAGGRVHWEGLPILITGATGFTGAVLARRLAALGAEVRAIARASSDTSALADLPITWFRGELHDKDLINRAVRGTAYIFHLAAAFRKESMDPAEYRRVHVTGTQHLAHAAGATPGFRRFVHVSTVGVHGHVEHPPIDEEGPFNPGDDYQRTKLEGEIWLRNFAAQTGLSYSVVRPTGIYGPGDRRLLKFFRMASRPVLFLVGRGPCLYHLIHVEDLVSLILLTATHPEARNEVFIGGNPASIPLLRFAEIVAAELGTRFRVVRLPAPPLFALAAACEWLCRKISVAPPLYRRRVAFFTKDRSFDTRKIRERLGFECRYSHEEGLAETTRWYTGHGWL